MSDIKIIIANPSVISYLTTGYDYGYKNESNWTTRTSVDIININYTGTNPIIVRKLVEIPYTYTKDAIKYNDTYKYYAYYLIGKNIKILSVSHKPQVRNINEYYTTDASFTPNNMDSALKTQSQNNIVFDYNWLIDTSDYVTFRINRKDEEIVQSDIPCDNYKTIPSAFSLSAKNCILGIPKRIVDASKGIETYYSPLINKCCFQTYSPTFNLYDYSSDSAYKLTTFKIKPSSDIPQKVSDYRYIPRYTSQNAFTDNFLFERNGDMKYGLALSTENNYITEWDLLNKSIEKYISQDLPFDIFSSTFSEANEGKIPTYNPLKYVAVYRSAIRNGFLTGYNSLCAGFPSYSFNSPYVPYENILIIGAPVSDLIDESNNYVQTGNLPSDAIYIETDDNGVPTSWSGKDAKPQGEDGKQSVTVDDMELPSPTRGALTAGACRYYLMTKEAMETFLHWFWYENHGLEDVFDNFWTNMYGNLKETILSYQYFPCTTSALGTISSTQENILLGRLVSTQTASRLNGLPSTILLGSINIKSAYKHFNTFVDWEGYTNFQIYLPFAGIVKLPTKSVQNAVLKVYYCVDVGTGQMNYIIKSYPNGGENGFVVLETTTPIGETIPISLMDDMENKTKLAQTAVEVVGSTIGLAASVATGNIAGAAIATGGLVSGAASASNAANPNIMIRTAEHSGQRMISGVGQIANEAMQYQSDTPSAVGQITGLMGKWSPLKCYLIIDYPTVDNASGGYNRHVGYLNYKPYKLSSLSGFTTCVKPQIDFKDTAPLLKEIEELYQLMESGIIL